MKRLLRSPVVNAVCLTVFTAFYACVFFLISGNLGAGSALSGRDASPLWSFWCKFLAAGHQVYIAYALTAVTILVVVLLLIRRRPYDEYHTAILTHCLVIAAMLTLAAIEVFYLLILSNPADIIEKFTLFIVIHWTTIVFDNLAYVLLCRWR